MLVRHLPVDCSIRHAFGADTWTPEMVLLGDLFAALTRQAHPRAPKPGPDPTLDRRLLAQRQRQRRRQHARRQLHAHQ